MARLVRSLSAHGVSDPPPGVPPQSEAPPPASATTKGCSAGHGGGASPAVFAGAFLSTTSVAGAVVEITPDPQACAGSPHTRRTGAGARVRRASPFSPPPIGSPDAQTAGAITGVVHKFFGCLAADDPMMPICSQPSHLTRYIDEPRTLRTWGLASATPTPLPPDATVIYEGPWNFRQLPDGRVSTVVWFNSEDEHPEPGVTVIWIFARESDAWRLDDSFGRVFILSSGTTSEEGPTLTCPEK